ncbi:hypothetical protein ACFFLS_09885 [Flavobacterium procerum]|uniref:Lipoprotein n=1 Tax=Flavobacterium procerum TaxID=1455569 RepID=A0ABV6BPH8_9FLAO
MNKTVVILLMFCFIGCDNQKTINPEEISKKTSEKFDLALFNSNKKGNLYEYLLGDTIVRLYAEDNFYKKELSFDNYAFKSVLVYSKTTNMLVSDFFYFYGMPIGIWKTYDENGNLVNEKNNDEGFDFAVKDLIGMFKKELQIDLINDDNYKSLVVNRFSDTTFYVLKNCHYLIEIATVEGIRTIKVDGNDGAVLNDETVFAEE